MILLECLTWVPSIWGELMCALFTSRMSKGPPVGRDHIPDDIIIDILSRLPADRVLKCRRVCKKWRTLISSPSFAELHLKRGATSAPPSIFVQRIDRSTGKQKEMCFHICDADEASNFVRRRRKITTKVRTQWFQNIMFLFEPSVCNSCDGLLVLRATTLRPWTLQAPTGPVQYEQKIFILNPVTKELVCIQAPFFIYPPCGIYRDAITREYKLLLYTIGDDVQCYYYTVSLKTMVMKKLEYSSTWYSRWRFTRMIPSKGCLHWFVENSGGIRGGGDGNYSIMVFNTETEDFRVLPHPGNEPICRLREIPHLDMELLETKGNLWLFNMFKGEIIILVLEDHANWAWDMRYKINLDWDTWHFHFAIDWDTWLFPFGNDTHGLTYYPCSIEILGIKNGVEVLMCWRHRGMFWYNVEEKSVRKAAIFEAGDIRSDSPTPVNSCSYTKTLVRIDPNPIVVSHETSLLVDDPPLLNVLSFVSVQG